MLVMLSPCLSPCFNLMSLPIIMKSLRVDLQRYTCTVTEQKHLINITISPYGLQAFFLAFSSKTSIT